MGRHSRKGAAPSLSDTGRVPVVEAGTGTGRRRKPQGPADREAQAAPAQNPRPYGASAASGAYGTPAQGTPAHGAPVHDTPAHGTPAHGSAPGGAQGPRASAHGGPVRGGHPAHDEGGAPSPVRRAAPRTPVAGPGAAGGSGRRAGSVPGPRRTDSTSQEPADAGRQEADGREGTDAADGRGGADGRDGADGRGGADGRTGRGRGLTYAGIAAAAVTTVLAVVVAGQVAERQKGPGAPRAAETAGGRVSDDTASRSDGRSTPRTPPAAPAPRRTSAPTYEQLMTRQFPIDPKLTGNGEFQAVPGYQKAPGKGRLIRYRIDVEKGIGLDPALFADAVHKTLNDPRSWAGRGAMTFERIATGEPEFVVTLASPGTTAKWCAKSGLDTTVDNVSCDSASTERVMINAFRWAQGSETFGPKAMHAYRQMLINHEVGHRLGNGHVNCRTPGALAPVMQQQTKSLEIDGIKCRPNPWVHPGR
ncbi:DUF3152 domain-containing protein [Streptomyces sp.]|uniref:DUF3152 domain-containing protein n=1 Tax=Streptomyces sp. TaxID=1931 RepID=UPI0028113464|nr:DUF3152 domain-containing protein [Streptomyces sp.]